MTIMRINRPLGPILVLILALLGSSLVLAEEPDPALRIVPEDARASEWGIAISPDGRFLASGGDNGLVSVWDLARLRPLWQCQRRAIKIRALEFSLDGSRLYGFTEDGQFWVWEGLTGAVISTSPDVRAGVYTASFSPDRSWAIVDAYGYDGKAWDTVKGESTLQWSNRKGIIRALAIAPDGDRFLSADTENRFKLWEKGWQSATASRKGPPDGGALLPGLGP